MSRHWIIEKPVPIIWTTDIFLRNLKNILCGHYYTTVRHKIYSPENTKKHSLLVYFTVYIFATCKIRYYSRVEKKTICILCTIE